MREKSQEPKRDFGFYATVPRIVRTQYPKLSHTEKWLYVCLKDLCGDKGTCFRTLRSLSEETDISIASLSKMIPNLHKAGLIHAEKKRRTESGKEVWHITIADIWAENAKVCSKNKQSTGEVVQNTNNVVQNLNEVQKDCSKNERDCSKFSDRRKNTEERTNIEERTEEERKKEPARESNVSTGDESFIRSSNFSSSFSSQETKLAIVLTEDEQRILDFGKKDLFKARTPEVTGKVKSECAELAEHIRTQDQFDSLLGYVRAKLKAPYHLKNMVNALNDWLQTQEQPTKSSGSSEEVTDSDIAAMVYVWSRELKDPEHAEEHQARVVRIQRECGLDNSKFFKLLWKARDGANYAGTKDMNGFFTMLNQELVIIGKKAPTLATKHLVPLSTLTRH